MAFRRFRGGLVFLLLLPLTAAADTVHVFVERNLNGTISRTGDVTVDTLTSYTPASPVQVSGYIFTGWTISTVQDFVSRDHYGRSLETVAVTVYEATTLTANYLPSGFDEDADGLADGWELYWFGNLDQGAADDSDGDGYTQVVEFALGTNPHLRNRKLRTGIISDVGQTVTYNPDGIAMLTIRSEPEGKLFATTREYVRQGAVRNTAAYNPNNSSFSYWMVNGERQADARGRAIDSLSVTMPPYDLELVAVSKDDVIERKIGYWYGIDTALDSDTDGDGYTLAVELALGTNPLLPNRKLREGVLSGQGEIVQYNPDCISRYTIRSEPEGRLFATRSDYAKAGTPLSTPTCNPDTTTFAYWTFNSVRQADHRGRALDSVSFVMPTAEVELVAVCIDKMEDRKISYWYGAETALDSDTDGDGYTLAVELALGTNPLVANRKSRQGIVSAVGETCELNLQVYEQVRGTLVGDAFVDLFTSPIAGTDGTVFFGGTPIWPIVADLNNDGLFDIVIESVDSGVRIVYLNVGVLAGPEFEVHPWSDEWEPLVMANRHASTDATLDTPIVNGLSCTYGDADRDSVADLLASDVDGRIWYYKGTAVTAPVGEDADGTVWRH